MKLIDVVLVEELDENNEDKTNIIAEQESTGQKEFYLAAKSDFAVDYKLLVWDFEYNNQPYAEIGGNRYSIIRTFQGRDSEKIELYLGSKVGVNSGK